MSKRFGASVAGFVLLATSAGHAADLDYRAPPPVIEGIGPPLRLVRRPPPPSPCHVIAAPRFNLSQDDVVRAEPQVVCLSRGLYSDSFN